MGLVKTTIDIPDETYRAIKILASHRGTTVRQLVLEGLALVSRKPSATRKKFKIPTIPSSRPGKLELDNETIYDIIDFP